MTSTTTLSSSDLTVGLSYRIRNGTDLDKVLVYKGPKYYFTCKYGATWFLALDFYDCYTITGPVPKDVLTAEEEQERQIRREERGVARKDLPYQWVTDRFKTSGAV